MMHNMNGKPATNLIKGDFVTDGETFVFRLSGTPLAGVGKSAAAAFDDLIRLSGETAPLVDRLREVAHDQQDEKAARCHRPVDRPGEDVAMNFAKPLEPVLEPAMDRAESVKPGDATCRGGRMPGPMAAAELVRRRAYEGFEQHRHQSE